MTKILITGGTGLVGKQLQQVFKKQNIEVVILTRNPKQENEFKWDINQKYIDEKAFENITHIIHLAGAGIADKRWTITRKKELINSRVDSANLLFEKIKEYKIPLQGFISASGIGYYGAITSDKIYSENDTPHNDFIAKICIEWEKSANQFKQLNIPVTILRTGIVLTKFGGALPKINTPLFLAALGDGKQYMPWVHIDDLSNLYFKAITDNNFTGIYNAVAPEHQTNKNFTKILSKSIHKPIFPLNAPAFVLNIVLGEMSDILLKGSRISSEKTKNVYKFQYPDLKTALKNIYNDK
ncbi:TIGR01777 family oxidoreductase [Tenacibaculum pacificus]|uniref:TIGR01777 family oxidoreductase n=1 Tax=Tenacibaculum pacificus TaxID=3018314 RepID=UPI0022F403FB|nr:TIGR01777 family oxidoreductase [Tenacibaculum pacificus]WBX72800.1 TIGR01777 family oxidoreductase [Tenacibaculum pacificus]